MVSGRNGKARMARRFGYYDFDAIGTAKWNAIAFPDGDSTQVPMTEGVYRFICNSEGNKQTLFADIAPSTYGHSLRACYNHHVAIRKDTLAELL